jgi:hypothetical protein
MDYTLLQLSRIRAALKHYQQYGGASGSGKIAWEDVARDIDAYTDAPEPPEAIEKYTKNYGNKLSQFVNGMGPQRNRTLRKLNSELVARIADFLAHKEVSLLLKADTVPDEIELSLATHIREFFLSGDRIQNLSEWPSTGGCAYAGARFADAASFASLLQSSEGPVLLRPGSVISHTYLELHETRTHAVKEAYLAFTTDIHDFPVTLRGEEKRLSEIKTGFLVYQNLDACHLYLRCTRTSETHHYLIHLTDQDDTRKPGQMLLLSPNERNFATLSTLSGPLSSSKTTDWREALKQLSAKLKTHGQTDNSGFLREVGSDYFLAKMQDDVSLFCQNEYATVRIGRNTENILKFSTMSEDQKTSLNERFLESALRLDFSNFEEMIAAGARFDLKQVGGYGVNALQAFAIAGFDHGVLSLLEYPDRCDFKAVDRRGMLASEHAMVFGNNPALADILIEHERAAGVTLDYIRTAKAQARDLPRGFSRHP